MLDAHQLNIFLIAAELENFSEAARRLRLSQPSVSAQIQSLERKLGTQLFRRAGRHIALTENGQALLPLAREMVDHSIRIKEAMASLSGTVFGQLKLGCTTASGKYLLPRLTAHFLNQHPQVQLICDVVPRSSVLTALLDGTIHLAVTSTRELSKEMEYHSLATDEIILIVSADHPWASQGEISIHDLLEERFILREATSGTHETVEKGLAPHGIQIDQLRTVMVTSNSEAIRTAVEENIGVAFVSRLVASASIQLGRISEIKVSDLDLTQKLYIGQNNRRPATKAQAAFLEFIQVPASRARLRLEN